MKVEEILEEGFMNVEGGETLEELTAWYLGEVRKQLDETKFEQFKKQLHERAELNPIGLAKWISIKKSESK